MQKCIGYKLHADLIMIRAVAQDRNYAHGTALSFYRDFLVYANFTNSILIYAIFQNIPEILALKNTFVHAEKISVPFVIFLTRTY